MTNLESLAPHGVARYECSPPHDLGNSMLPRVFIGSSSEGLPIAYALQSALDDASEVTVWTQDVFRPTEYILESLLKRLRLADFGLFVFSPDDVLRMRGVEYAATRDNVLFEFGLFVGHFGRERSIIIAPKGENPRLPSDLLGVTVLKYGTGRSDENLDAALGPATSQLRKRLAEIRLDQSAVPGELELPILERGGLLSSRQREILKEIEKRGQCSKEDLSTRFPGIPVSELHYRLEQLRLLMFVSVVSSNSHSDTAPKYAVSTLYADARQNQRNRLLPTD
jgi:hypothetical protein